MSSSPPPPLLLMESQCLSRFYQCIMQPDFTLIAYVLSWYHPVSLFFLAGTWGPCWKLFRSRHDFHSVIYTRELIIPNRYKVTTLGLVPSLVQQLVTHPKVDKADFSSVLAMMCGAAYLPREFLSKLVSLGPKEVNFTEGGV